MNAENIALVDNILGTRPDAAGTHLGGYRNHVCRMVNFCFAQREFDHEAKQKIIIAGCFHDIGIWTADTFDYLAPSIDAANEYLQRNGLETWLPEIGLMIDQHHKLRRYTDGASPLVEVFRRADLVDLSLGLIRWGIAGDRVREVKTQFPNAGFHNGLLRVAGRWVCRHPLNPLPVLKF